MVGIKGLARHLNISIGTVSRALNDRPDVNKETRQRVLEAAKTLGYTPNQSGRSLRKGATGVIAAMIPTHDKIPLGDTVFIEILQSLKNELTLHGLDLVILLCGSNEDAFDFLKRTVERGFADGIIISDIVRDDKRIDYLIEKNIPFVSFGRTLTEKKYNWIDLDFETVAETIVDRLTGFGHKRIALATMQRPLNYHYIFEDRFRQELAKRGLILDDELVTPISRDETSGYTLGSYYLELEQRPDAIVLVDETRSFGLYRRLAEGGLEVGKDIAVIAAIRRAHSEFLSPQLTCFRTDLTGLGQTFCHALLQQLPSFKNEGPTDLIEKRWPVKLLPGDSDYKK